MARILTRRVPRIVMYHGFKAADDENRWALPVERFRRQVEFIKKHFVPLTVSELVAAKRVSGDYPKRGVAITVDDGYESFFELALPILQEMSVPATVYVVTDLVEREDWIWTDKLIYLMNVAGDNSGAFGGLTTDEALAYFKTLPVDQRDRELQQAASRCGVAIPTVAPERYRLMSWEQIGRATATGLVEIGSHTCTHPILSRLSDDASWREIEQSKMVIENRVQTGVTSFCFPNGQPGDYTQTHLRMLSEAGYTSAVGTQFGYVVRDSHPYALPRLNFDGDDLNVFAKYLDGIEYLQRKPRYDSLR